MFPVFGLSERGMVARLVIKTSVRFWLTSRAIAHNIS